MKFVLISLLAFALIFSGCVNDNKICTGEIKSFEECVAAGCPRTLSYPGTCIGPNEQTFKEIANFERCAAAGYPIMESYPRQCSIGEKTFTEVIEMSEEFCDGFGGNWNECSSKCAIDNQGTFIECPDVCDTLCECGGIAGFGCPGGYTCKMPSGIADALGYCVPQV